MSLRLNFLPSVMRNGFASFLASLSKSLASTVVFVSIRFPGTKKWVNLATNIPTLGLEVNVIGDCRLPIVDFCLLASFLVAAKCQVALSEQAVTRNLFDPLSIPHWSCVVWLRATKKTTNSERTKYQ